MQRDYVEKVACNYQFSPGDLEATPDNVRKMLVISFIGALGAAAIGVGPGMIFCPVLVQIGIEAQVATATGMYLTTFTALSATLSVIVFKKINLPYAIWVLLMTVFGTLPGIFSQQYVV